MNAIAKTKGMGFALQPNSMDEAFRMAEMLAGSQMVPKNYQGKPQDALVAMMMGSELGLNPIQSLANVAVINGKPAIYGDALLALVQNHPKFGGHEESFEENGMVATCTVWRKGDATKHTVTFSQADARKAGLWEKSGPWTQYPKRMLMWRARGYALRDKFADALGGLITVEEARDIPEQDMGSVQRHEPKQEARPALEYYADEQMAENMPKWREIVQSGKRTPRQIVSMIESKHSLSDAQKSEILNLEQSDEKETA
jgi:hypothetical protein